MLSLERLDRMKKRDAVVKGMFLAEQTSEKVLWQEGEAEIGNRESQFGWDSGKGV